MDDKDPWSWRNVSANIVIGLVVTVLGGIILAYVLQSDRFGPSRSQAEATPTEEIVGSLSDATRTTDVESNWRPLSFVFSNPKIWDQSGDNRYTAVEQKEADAFAWSTESFEGDVKVSLDMYSAVEALELEYSELDRQVPNQNSGCVVIYGDGPEYSDGSLIFCVDWDGYYSWKDTRYTEDEPIAFIPNYNRSDKVYSVTIDIADDLATMYVNGESVFSYFFDTKEIDRSGRIGLLRYWENGEITFSNIQVKAFGDGD